MLIVLAAAAAAVLVVLALVAADRRCAAHAERRAGQFLSTPFGRPVDVSVVATPFLTQALRGRYRDVRVRGAGLQIGTMTGATLDARLRNAYLSTRALVGRRVEELTCEHVSGRVVLPYSELTRVAKVPDLTLRFERDGQLMASAALPVPGVSQLVRVNGHAVWSVDGGGSLRLRIRGVSVVGIAVPGVVLSQLLPALDIPIPLPELPYGLRIDELRPAPDGLVVIGSAAAPVFRRTPFRPEDQDARLTG